MQFYERKARFDELNKYCHLAKPGDFVEITEWHNGEGIDVTIGTNKMFQLTWGELEAVQVLARVPYEGS